jgi:hypothetical protein
MSKEKKYVGNGKAITTKYGTMYNISLKLEDLKKLPVNEKGYIRLTLAELKNADKYGNTHTCFENDYVDSGTKPQTTNANEDITSDLPF